MIEVLVFSFEGVDGLRYNERFVIRKPNYFKEKATFVTKI